MVSPNTLSTELVTSIRNSFAATSIVAFGFATELPKESDSLLTGSGLCLVASMGAEAVLSFFREKTNDA